MNGPSISFLSIVLAVTIGISVLTFALTRKVFADYRTVKFTYLFWTLNVLAIGGIGLGRGQLDNYLISGFLIELIVGWFMAQVVAIGILPGYFILRRLVERQIAVTTVPVDLTRRKLIKGMALSLPTVALGISGYGTVVGSRAIEYLDYAICLPGLDSTVNGFKIAQISDAHIGLFFSVSKLAAVLRQLVAARVDTVLITGDLIDDLKALPELVACLNEFAGQLPRGIYFSWGNHEYFRDFAAVQSAFASSKIYVLRNENALLVAAATPLYIIGVDYPWEKAAQQHKNECQNMLAKALTAVPVAATKVLMSHHPDLIDYGYDQGIDLTLTGHTHGGQLAVFGQPILPVRYKYMRGMYNRGRQYGYVNAGAGSWFPFRLGCPAEIAIFTLQQGQ